MKCTTQMLLLLLLLLLLFCGIVFWVCARGTREQLCAPLHSPSVNCCCSLCCCCCCCCNCCCCCCYCCCCCCTAVLLLLCAAAFVGPGPVRAVQSHRQGDFRPKQSIRACCAVLYCAVRQPILATANDDDDDGEKHR